MSENFRERILRLPETPKIMLELVEFLKEKGHICAYIRNNKLSWCQEDKCQEIVWKEHIKQVQIENGELIGQLKAQGHKCIKILECIPPQISWCHQNPCKLATNANSDTN